MKTKLTSPPPFKISAALWAAKICLIIAFSSVALGASAQQVENISVKDSTKNLLFKCPPFILPAVQYNYDNDLGHGFALGVKIIQPGSKCDCSGPFGALCYLYGPTYRFNAGYFPATKTIDLTANAEYRVLPLFIGLSGGYAFNSETGLPKTYWHAGPTVGIDVLMVQLLAGYAWRSEKIGGKSGAFNFSFIFSPPFDKKSKPAIRTIRKSTSDDRKSFRGRD